MTEDSPLQFDGERFLPECVREIAYEHWHRYIFAAQFVKDARVLDAACGEGYGASLLAKSAREVVGVDVSEATIRHATGRYGDAENLTFAMNDVTQLDFPENSFDLIVSFETLEHLEHQELMLTEFRRVLKPDGFLIISTPDKAIYTDQMGTDNEFHVKELYRHEFEALICSRFPANRILGQKLGFVSTIWGQGPLSEVIPNTIDENGAVAKGWDFEPVYLLAICAAEDIHLPDLQNGFWSFSERDESVYQHYNRLIRQDQIAYRELQRRQAVIDDLREELAALREQISHD